MSDPAHFHAVAAGLRRRLAHLDATRRRRAALIRALDGYSYRLKVANMVDGQLAGRLRRDAAHAAADAERAERQQRQRTRRAAA